MRLKRYIFRRNIRNNILIELIQNAVGGCARNWAEVIADHLLAMYETSCRSIGKTVFLSREDAEQALRKEDEGK